MSPTFQATEGIILRVIPFRDHDQIVFLFTHDAGFIKLLCKGSRRQRQEAFVALTKIEVVYCEKRGEIFSCCEMFLIDSFPVIHREWIYLETACDLLYAILASQLLGKAAPQLYALLCVYLQKIPQTANPWVLAASFRLKLLKHDGLIVLPLVCSECQQLLQTAAFTQHSEGRCANHQLSGSLPWSKEELEVLYLLATCQNYRDIAQHDLSPQLREKIAVFFESCAKMH